ncbi:MAG: hypothetical protein KDA89_09040 [Planctomycetaceae bacterium]|nr:hypothetical protein [Planctomycetaceae bacterium]MCA9048859.1 hypothetical protein [Planctomycetaceae bacterium]
MKTIQFGPTGALITVAGNNNYGMCVRMLAMLPVIPNLVVQVCLLGKRRLELSVNGSRPGISRLPNAEQFAKRVVPAGLDALLNRVSLSETAFSAWEFLIPQGLVSKTGYLGFYIGNSDPDRQPDWHLNGETFLLEAAKGDFFKADAAATVSGFRLMTRGNAAKRLNRLRETYRILQRDDEVAADALYDIFLRLIGGKDDELMTCDL